MLCMQDDAVFIDHRLHSFSEFCCCKRQSIFPLHHNKTEAPVTSSIIRLVFFYICVIDCNYQRKSTLFCVFDNFQFVLWNGQSKYTWFLWQINMLSWSSLSQRWQFRELASLNSTFCGHWSGCLRNSSKLFSWFLLRPYARGVTRTTVFMVTLFHFPITAWLGMRVPRLFLITW